jgi:catechol 2,3-dioxygenase-like lactoylglutathione lyase family enzyme
MYTTIIQVRDADKPPWRGIDHVQLAMPAGGEDAARAFYAGVLGIPEVPKPPALAARGGCWFELGPTRVHVGVEADFRPARKAHPALLVAGLRDFVARQGLAITWADDVPDVVHGYVDDPFGNRIELVDAGPSGALSEGTDANRDYSLTQNAEGAG